VTPIYPRQSSAAIITIASLTRRSGHPISICLPSMCYLSYGETPLVNCGPRSYLLYSHCLLYSYTTTVFHSICSFLCLQQTGEIDNLIVSWEQSTRLCCVQVPHYSWQSKALDEAPYKLSGAVAKLASITFLSLPFSYWINIPWFCN
jgi:hypothetical protein